MWGGKPWRRRLRGQGGGEGYGLLRVELHDELLLHRRGDLRALGLAQHLRGQLIVVGLQPGRDLGDSSVASRITFSASEPGLNVITSLSRTW